MSQSPDYTAPTGAIPYPPEPSSYTPLADHEPAGTTTSTTDTAKEQAGQVGQSAAEAGQHVAGVARDQASNVAGEAAQQARNLLDQTTSELREQAATQQQRIAQGIRSLSSELASMAERSDQSGTASGLVRQTSQKTEQIANWLDERDPGSLVQEVTGFARRRPGAFLAIAAGAGLLAGRLTRGAIDASRDDKPADIASDSSATSSRDSGFTVPVATAPVTVVEPVSYEPASYEPQFTNGRSQP